MKEKLSGSEGDKMIDRALGEMPGELKKVGQIVLSFPVRQRII
jgi:hypothetical protein